MTTEVSHLLTKIREAGLAADAWPEALKALTDGLGIGGAACIVFNKRTKAVDWVFNAAVTSCRIGMVLLPKLRPERDRTRR
jgi:hypothetical protein